MLDTLRIESRTVVGLLYTLDLLEVQAPQIIDADFSMDNLISESGTLQILEQNERSVAGVFSFKMRNSNIPIPGSARMEGGFHVRFSDIFDEDDCAVSN